MRRPHTLGVQGADPQHGVLESQTEGREIGVAPRRGHDCDARGALRWRSSMRRHGRGRSPCRRGRSDGMRIADFNPRDSSRRPGGHPPTSAGHPARDSAGQRRATTGHRRTVTRHGAVHRYRSRGQHHGTRPDLLAVPEAQHCQQQEREVVRMQSSTHHVLIMLTRCGLERHRGHPHRIRAGQNRNSRRNGIATRRRRAGCVPWCDVLTMRNYRGVSHLSRSRFVDRGKDIPGIAVLPRHATGSGPFLP